jgi:hypothetical protein
MSKLHDLNTGEPIGDATQEQIDWAAGHGHRDTGGFLVDGDGTPRHEGSDEAVYGKLRSVYIEG